MSEAEVTAAEVVAEEEAPKAETNGSVVKEEAAPVEAVATATTTGATAAESAKDSEKPKSILKNADDGVKAA